MGLLAFLLDLGSLGPFAHCIPFLCIIIIIIMQYISIYFILVFDVNNNNLVGFLRINRVCSITCTCILWITPFYLFVVLQFLFFYLLDTLMSNETWKEHSAALFFQKWEKKVNNTKRIFPRTLIYILRYFVSLCLSSIALPIISFCHHVCVCVEVEQWITQFAITFVQFNYCVSWCLLVLFANESANRLEVDANKVIGPHSRSAQLL